MLAFCYTTTATSKRSCSCTQPQDVLEEWLRCQGKWLYLQPIFGAEEIMRHIPREGGAFKWVLRLARARTRAIALHVGECLYAGLVACPSSPC